jgi:protein involved in ribonucleotide reduction
MEVVIAFQKDLKSKSWIAPGIDYVEGNYKNTVKYFNNEDKSLAEKVAAIGKQNFNSDFRTVAILSSKYKVPRGQIEVWVNNR